MAFFELRQYKIRPGKMAQWLDFMENEIIPFQVSKGAVICGSFQGLKAKLKENGFMRRFTRVTSGQKKLLQRLASLLIVKRFRFKE